MRLPQVIFSTQAYRRLTPTSTLSAESATEADSATTKTSFVGRNETAPDLLPTIYPSRAHSDIQVIGGVRN